LKARRIAAALAGVLLFAFAAFAMNRLALAVWPAYAVAYPSRSFSPAMLLARLSISCVALVASGAVVAAIARDHHLAVLITSAVLLLISGINHLTEPTWSHYPLWYHLVFIGSIGPCVVIGGRLR
jgi:hypothetical protein